MSGARGPTRERGFASRLHICNYVHAMKSLEQSERLSTAAVAQLAGVHKDTLLRWLRAGWVTEPARDRHGWRYFTPGEAESVVRFANSSAGAAQKFVGSIQGASPQLESLERIDWDFADAKTNYLTHGIHPYPAKFIPQIPNALIQELSCVGDTVGDIFCGSGTTLVEALTLKRHAVGLDANPLACLISRAKTTLVTEEQAAELESLVSESYALSEALAASASQTLLSDEIFVSKAWRPAGDDLNFWFDGHVVEELAELLEKSHSMTTEATETLALAAFSSIVVSVSRQDSDTRYVRRQKDILPGDTCRRFARSLEQALRVVVEFTEFVEPRFACNVFEANLLDAPEVPVLDLVVCSPPYPNAYSYHLYHRTRMVWLEMDQPKFKYEEIGSHRKYSSKGQNAATVETFSGEFTQILSWLSRVLKRDRYACFVVGDSTLKGKRICNADLIRDAGQSAGFLEVRRLSRTMQSTKKSFNPSIGRIKTEDILILQNKGA